jgi:hypothetical protein
MTTPAQRKILNAASRAMYHAMPIGVLESMVAELPPDPKFAAAIELLTIDEIELALDGGLSRDQILAIGRYRAAHG